MDKEKVRYLYWMDKSDSTDIILSGVQPYVTPDLSERCKQVRCLHTPRQSRHFHREHLDILLLSNAAVWICFYGPSSFSDIEHYHVLHYKLQPHLLVLKKLKNIAAFYQVAGSGKWSQLVLWRWNYFTTCLKHSVQLFCFTPNLWMQENRWECFLRLWPVHVWFLSNNETILKKCKNICKEDVCSILTSMSSFLNNQKNWCFSRLHVVNSECVCGDLLLFKEPIMDLPSVLPLVTLNAHK